MDINSTTPVSRWTSADKFGYKTIKFAEYGLFCWVPYIFPILMDRHSIQIKKNIKNIIVQIYILKIRKVGWKLNGFAERLVS